MFPQVLQSHSGSPLSRWCLATTLKRIENERLSCPCWSIMQGKLLSHPIPTLVLGFASGVVIVPELGLLFCQGSCLVYLELEVLISPPPRGTGVGSTNLLLD
jgi:hypothetical protein